MPTPKRAASTAPRQPLDEETASALTLFNTYLIADREQQKHEKAVRRAERAKDEAAAVLRKLNDRRTPADEVAAAETAYRQAAEALRRVRADKGGARASASTDNDSDGPPDETDETDETRETDETAETDASASTDNDSDGPPDETDKTDKTDTSASTDNDSDGPPDETDETDKTDKTDTSASTDDDSDGPPAKTDETDEADAGASTGEHNTGTDAGTDDDPRDNRD